MGWTDFKLRSIDQSTQLNQKQQEWVKTTKISLLQSQYERAENKKDLLPEWLAHIDSLDKEQCLRLLYWHSDVNEKYAQFCENIMDALAVKDRTPSGFKALNIGGVLIFTDYNHAYQLPEGRAVVITPGQSISTMTLTKNRPS